MAMGTNEEHDRLDQIRRAALQRVEQTQRYFTIAIVMVALVEAAAILLFLLQMNFQDRLHRLIFAHAIMVYGTLGMGLVALGVFVRHNVQRVLSAIELLALRG